MTDKTTDQTQDHPTDIESRLARLEETVRDLSDRLVRKEQAGPEQTRDDTQGPPRNDRLEEAKKTAQDTFSTVKTRAGAAARGAGLPLWAVVVIGGLAVIGLADLVDLDLPKGFHF